MGQKQVSKLAPEQWYLAPKKDLSDPSDQPLWLTISTFSFPTLFYTDSSEQDGAGNPSVADHAGIP